MNSLAPKRLGLLSPCPYPTESSPGCAPDAISTAVHGDHTGCPSHKPPLLLRIALHRGAFPFRCLCNLLPLNNTTTFWTKGKFTLHSAAVAYSPEGKPSRGLSARKCQLGSHGGHSASITPLVRLGKFEWCLESPGEELEAFFVEAVLIL